MIGLRLRRAAAAVPALLLAGLIGCGEPQRAAVEGIVSYDGTPVDGGNISFVPDGSGGQTVGASIKDGKYTIDAPQGPAPGKYKVSITWNKRLSGKKGDPDTTGGEDTKQVLPEKFNKATTLTAEIKPGSNTVDFPLMSK